MQSKAFYFTQSLVTVSASNVTRPQSCLHGRGTFDTYFKNKIVITKGSSGN